MFIIVEKLDLKVLEYLNLILAKTINSMYTKVSYRIKKWNIKWIRSIWVIKDKKKVILIMVMNYDKNLINS